MRTVDLVKQRLQELNDDYLVAVLVENKKPAMPFAQWAIGKVLLDAESTAEARQNVLDGLESDGVLASSVYTAFMQTDEKHLVTALTFDVKRRPVFVLVPQL